MKELNLDSTDRKLLAELDKDCRQSNAQLGKKVGKSREAVKYRIQQLQARGILQRFITSINPNKFGYYMFKVYLKLENITDERERFFEELKQNKDIYWMGISDGVFDCVFAILAKDITTYYTRINDILSKWEHLIVSKVLGTMVDTQQFNKKFFTDEKEGSVVTFGGDVVQHDLDQLDYKLLDILANDARIAIAALARRCSCSIETVRGRMRKLEEANVILQYRIAVDLNKLGLEFFKAIIYFRSLSPKDEKALFEWMRVHPNALYYIRSLAPWEVEFEFAVESYQQFNAIINELRLRFPHVIRNYEHLIMIYETWMPAYKELFRQKENDKVA